MKILILFVFIFQISCVNADEIYNLLKKKTFFSLKDYLKGQIKAFGIKNIDNINMDTYESKNNFFSSRRSLHNNYNDYGRNITTIMIK